MSPPTTGPEGPGPVRDWRAVDWDDLRAVWAELLPQPDGPPRFQGKELTAQRAGWLFERIVMEGFRLDGLTIHHPFEIRGESGKGTREQLDGIVVIGWQGFLVESKFQMKGKPVDIDPIFRLHVLVEQRPAGTLGLFFSASGYTPMALESAGILKPLRVLLFNRLDLGWAFTVPNRMRAMIERKWQLALKNGKPASPIAEYDENQTPVALQTGFEGDLTYGPSQ